MADLSTVRAKVQDALDEADAALGQPSTTQKLTELQAQLDAANAQVTKLQGIVDQVKALVNG